MPTIARTMLCLLLAREHPDKLIKENRYAVGQIMSGGTWIGSCRSHDATPINDDATIRREKVVKHALL